MTKIVFVICQLPIVRTFSMCFLLDGVIICCSSILCMSSPFLSPEQCLIIVIVNSFMLGLEPSYLDKKGSVVGFHSTNRFEVLGLGHGFLTADVISYKQRGMLSLLLSC